MSILINLLPDIRQAKLREHRRRQLVSGVSVLVWVICGSVVALMAVYSTGQKVVIDNYTRSIADNKVKLQAVPGLVDALTAQEHLAELPTLYDNRVYMTKFFRAYSEVNPTAIGLTSMAIDAQNAMTINGTGDSYAAVAKLARALQASNVKIGTGAAEANTPYFSGVIITNVALAAKGVTFTLSANVDPGATTNGTK